VLLQQVTLPYVAHEECQDLLRLTKLNTTFRLDDSFNCAGGERGKDTCRGDGGGPLVCPLTADPDRYVQVGVVAWGIDCGLPNVPGVYASVPYGLCFIKWATKCQVCKSMDCTGARYSKRIVVAWYYSLSE
jgi:kallikrein